jgi:hypothetical protein
MAVTTATQLAGGVTGLRRAFATANDDARLHIARYGLPA